MHPKLLAPGDLTSSQAERMSAVYKQTLDDVNAKITAGGTVQVLKVLYQIAEKIATIGTLLELCKELVDAKQASNEQKKEQQKEFDGVRSAIEHSEPIEHAEEHVDAFDGNRDFLGSLA